MENCYQFSGMNVYEHGWNVHEWFMDLYNHIMYNTELEKPWRLPNWISNPIIKQKLLPLEVLKIYQIYHDLGKPKCRIVDEDGKQHFPDHAQVSYNLWRDNYDGSGFDKLVAHLILHDMDPHTVKGEDIDYFLEENLTCAISQILTGLAEIHSNAAYLDQLDSTNFKIKFKQLDKLGKKYFAKLETK